MGYKCSVENVIFIQRRVTRLQRGGGGRKFQVSNKTLIVGRFFFGVGL